MSSAGPTSTVSFMYDRVFTSEVVSRTALWMTSVIVSENTKVLNGSSWGSPSYVMARWLRYGLMTRAGCVSRTFTASSQAGLCGQSSRRTFMQVPEQEPQEAQPLHVPQQQLVDQQWKVLADGEQAAMAVLASAGPLQCLHHHPCPMFEQPEKPVMARAALTVLAVLVRHDRENGHYDRENGHQKCVVWYARNTMASKLQYM